MSRLTQLIAQVKTIDPQLAKELELEFRTISSRRSFGLNFERHRPESVELPGRQIRKGDKVRILPPRGTISMGDQRLWRVRGIERKGYERIARLELMHPTKIESQTAIIDNLVVVAEFRDYIYPGLVSTGKVERGGDKPFHTVINGENFHVLQALTFTHRGKIDAIYIDPPYNSGAKDWKYNNNYVEKDDLYRHSKWLAMMERRLVLARQLLNPENSALICTIDEKEYLNLGLLLKQTFPDARIQMVSSVINAKGIIRDNEFSRTNEFIYFVLLGKHRIKPILNDVEKDTVRWASLRRSDVESARGTKKGGPEQFYPIYVDAKTGKILEVGAPLTPDQDISEAPQISGCLTVFPVRDKGDVLEMNWGLTIPSLKERISKGYVKAVFSGKSNNKVTIYYLTSGQISDIYNENIIIDGYDSNGVAIVSYSKGKHSNPTTQWSFESHNAQSHGSDMIRAFLPGREFPFPKSLYAVEDALRIVVGDNKNANILDFFSGSGTTAHAVMRLNRQDGGKRQCILVTNNEVSADEEIELRRNGFRPGDTDWDKHGICDFITKPRIEAAITGKTHEDKDIKGDYKFNDIFPFSDGFEENAEFFTLTYESPLAVSHNRAFARVSALLWMRAGSEGKRLEEISLQGWHVSKTYGILTDLDKATPFCEAIKTKNTVRIAYIVTDDDRRFQSVTRHLPVSVESVRLYESYLNNFRFSLGSNL